MEIEYTPTPEQLDLLSRVVGRVTRMSGLPSQDAEDFSQSVHVRLLERQYDVFQRFRGQSSLQTYLTVVVRRMLLDWRNTTQGKWRPSAAATRMGEAGIALDQLISRDGYSLSEAIELMQQRGFPQHADTLTDMALSFPQRARRLTVGGEICESLRAVPFEDPVAFNEHRLIERQLCRTLAQVLRALPYEDRQILQLRFRDQQSIRNVALAIGVEPRKMYRRFEHLLRTLRRSLALAS